MIFLSVLIQISSASVERFRSVKRWSCEVLLCCQLGNAWRGIFRPAYCSESGCDGVNFLHRSPYGAVWLPYGSAAKPVLIANQQFGYCWTALARCQGFLSVFFLTPQQVGWGRVGQKLAQVKQTGQRDTPYHVMPCSAIKLGVEVDQGLSSKWPLLRDWLGLGLLVGGGEWWPLHHLFCYFFPPLIKLSSSWPLLLFLSTPQSDCGGNEQAAVRYPAVGWVNPQQAHMPSSHNALCHLHLMIATLSFISFQWDHFVPPSV